MANIVLLRPSSENPNRFWHDKPFYLCFLDAFSYLYRRVCPSVRPWHTSRMSETFGISGLNLNKMPFWSVKFISEIPFVASGTWNYRRPRRKKRENVVASLSNLQYWSCWSKFKRYAQEQTRLHKRWKGKLLRSFPTIEHAATRGIFRFQSLLG